MQIFIAREQQNNSFSSFNNMQYMLKNNLSGADLDILSFHEKNIALIHIYGDSIYDTLTKSDIV